MCGRFALFSDPTSVARALRLPPPLQGWPLRYNIAPGSWITGMLRYSLDGDPLFGELWWGYRPHWAGPSGPEPINARAEKLNSSRYFRGAFHKHRCLIPASGWYEWKPEEGGKQPYFFARQDCEPLFLGAIWEPLDDDTACCAIISEPARGIARDIHDRMPVVLDDRSLEGQVPSGAGIISISPMIVLPSCHATVARRSHCHRKPAPTAVVRFD